MFRFQHELDRIGCKVAESEVRRVLTNTLARMFPDRSSDDVLDHPSDAEAFAVAIREHFRNDGFDDELALSMLTDNRKNGLLPHVPRRPRPSLAKQMTDHQCGGHTEELIDLLQQVLEEKYSPTFNDETIRFRPSVARDYCETVRRLKGCPNLPDDLIFRTLNNARKRNGRRDGEDSEGEEVAQPETARLSDYRRAATLLRHASDFGRIQVLSLLRQCPLSVSDICEKTGGTQSNVSHRLALLRLGGAVDSSRDGKWQMYELTSVGRSLLDLVDLAASL